ncbi:hypothetical protein BGY98DRAFT_924086 [Russula aff. rugulosa BPL654]|nr:hypothetical protein BGY98DRAFT_924086 [Russula aff. rugulosa BPL654]
MLAISPSYHLRTLLLFTKSDMKTVIPPVTLFAAAAAPSCSLSRLPHALIWLWVHALQFGLANQTLPRSLAEDLLNHPDRPLPAGRISLRTARTLRWMMIPICLALSAVYGPRTMIASLCGSLYMVVYNDGGGARAHWLVRNALNAIGYGTAEAGTTLVICQRESDLDSIAYIAIVLSAGIILTTIHTQDYRDAWGDAAAGRVTLPIAYPTLSRPVTALLLITWSWIVSRTWLLDDITAGFMGVFSLIVGVSFVARTDVRADTISSHLYNVWLCAIYMLPVYYRLNLRS